MANHNELQHLIVAMSGRPISKWRCAPTLDILSIRVSRPKAKLKPRETMFFAQPCEKGLPAYSDVAVPITAPGASLLFGEKLMLANQLRASAAVDSSFLF